MRRALVALVVAAAAAGSMSACQQEPDTTLVAFLLAGSNSTRWEQWDEPSFRARVELTCPRCEYVTRNAEGDPATQVRQLDQVLADGADVIVLNAVTAERGEELVQTAGSVPVVAYDRFVAGADYYVSYDADAIGLRMARAAVAGLEPRSGVLIVNGAQTDPNGVAIKKAVHQVLAAKRMKVLAELDPESWSADEARVWVEKQLAGRQTGVAAILAANDAQAQGVAEALTASGVGPRAWPVVTGQDADLEALRRIVAGQQTLTVYKSFPREAEQAADIAVALATGGTVTGAEPVEGVDSFIFEPVVVTLQNLTDTVVRDGIYSTEQLCAGDLEERCTELGLR